MDFQVVIVESAGKSGRGTIIQDVQASPEICMDRITDLENYYKMVPKGTHQYPLAACCYLIEEILLINSEKHRHL